MCVCKVFLRLISNSARIAANHKLNYYSLKGLRPFCAFRTRAHFKKNASHPGRKGGGLNSHVERQFYLYREKKFPALLAALQSALILLVWQLRK